jgi:hypothetical protein
MIPIPSIKGPDASMAKTMTGSPTPKTRLSASLLGGHALLARRAARLAGGLRKVPGVARAFSSTGLGASLRTATAHAASDS